MVRITKSLMGCKKCGQEIVLLPRVIKAQGRWVSRQLPHNADDRLPHFERCRQTLAARRAAQWGGEAGHLKPGEVVSEVAEPRPRGQFIR